MKAAVLAVICLFVTMGVALGDYGGYGYGGYVPYAPQHAEGGFGNGGLLMLIGGLFLFSLLLGNNGLFNFSSSASTGAVTPVTIIQG